MLMHIYSVFTESMNRDILSIYFLYLASQVFVLPKSQKLQRCLTPSHLPGMTGRNLKFTSRPRELPSRDFRISLRRVRIPGANEERSGTLVVARRKKKEAPRPRYVAGTQTGVLVSTSLTYTSTRARARCPCTSREQVYPTPCSLLTSPPPSLWPPSGPLRTPFAYLVYTGGTNATTSSN